jgi:hypothetical protein
MTNPAKPARRPDAATRLTAFVSAHLSGLSQEAAEVILTARIDAAQEDARAEVVTSLVRTGFLLESWCLKLLGEPGRAHGSQPRLALDVLKHHTRVQQALLRATGQEKIDSNHDDDDHDDDERCIPHLVYG